MSSGSGPKDGRKKGRKPRSKGGRKGRDDQQHYAPPGSGGNSSRLDAKALLQSHVGVCLDTGETTSRRLTAIGKLQKCILDPRSYETIYEMYDKLFRAFDWGVGSASAMVIMLLVTPILVWNVRNARREMR